MIRVVDECDIRLEAANALRQASEPKEYVDEIRRKVDSLRKLITNGRS
jgi:hypothetical protein